MTPTVRPLTPDDYEALRDLRLEALRLHPEAFCARLADEEAMTREQWLARLASAVTLGGFLDGKLEGMVVYSRPKNPQLAHIGGLNALYVRDGARGTGLGDALLRTLIERAAGEVEQVKLAVNADNAPAVALYERHGFRPCGLIPRAILIDGRYYDELLMIRTVSASD